MLFQFDVTQAVINTVIEFSADDIFDLKAFSSNSISNGAIGTFSKNDTILAIGAFCVSFTSAGFNVEWGFTVE